jgi:hypothetical protein
MAALLTLPAATALGINMQHNPEQVAYLYGLGLLGTWATLIPSKVFETRPLDTSTRRLVSLLAGLVVGGLGIVLGRVLQPGLSMQHRFLSNPQDLEPIYFGLMYAVSSGWWGQVARDRRKRFRLFPIAWTILLAGLLMPLWPYIRPDGVAVAALIVSTAQVVSPWSEQASRYAQYVRASQKQGRKIKIA